MTIYTTALDAGEWLSGNSRVERALADAGIRVQRVSVASLGKTALIQIETDATPPRAVPWWVGTAAEVWESVRLRVPPSFPASDEERARYQSIAAEELPENREAWALKLPAEKYLTPGYYFDRWFRRVGARLVRVVMYEGGKSALVIVSVPKGTEDPSIELGTVAVRTTPTARNSELLTPEEMASGHPTTIFDLVDQKIRAAGDSLSAAAGKIAALVIAGIVVYVVIAIVRRR